ncbi:hypothetical protein VTG60DRAFT_1866 [Thermothelomyces hinnuleus]
MACVMSDSPVRSRAALSSTTAAPPAFAGAGGSSDTLKAASQSTRRRVATQARLRAAMSHVDVSACPGPPTNHVAQPVHLHQAQRLVHQRDEHRPPSPR